MRRCEDYPACGHTDGLGCDWTSPNDNPDLWFCTHHGWGEGTWHRVGQPCPNDDWDMED